MARAGTIKRVDFPKTLSKSHTGERNNFEYIFGVILQLFDTWLTVAEESRTQ